MARLCYNAVRQMLIWKKYSAPGFGGTTTNSSSENCYRLSVLNGGNVNKEADRFRSRPVNVGEWYGQRGFKSWSQSLKLTMSAGP